MHYRWFSPARGVLESDHKTLCACLGCGHCRRGWQQRWILQWSLRKDRCASHQGRLDRGCRQCSQEPCGATMRKRFAFCCCFLLLVFHIGAQTLFVGFSEVRCGPGVTALRPLSDFFMELKGTPFDTPVFFMGDSDAPLCAAVVSGSHANEIAGILASYWIIERCRVSEGRLIVVPHANASGSTWSLQDATAPRILRLGNRVIRYGARLSNPAQEILPDPASFVPPQASGDFPSLAGYEARNLNRQYPGRQDGNRTAQTAYALAQMLLAENVRIALDLHEASMGSSLVWSMITRTDTSMLLRLPCSTSRMRQGSHSTLKTLGRSSRGIPIGNGGNWGSTRFL